VTLMGANTVHCRCGEVYLPSERWCPSCDQPANDPGVPVGAPVGEQEVHGEADSLRRRLLRGDEILSIPAKEPLIEGWLDRGDFGCVYGRPGGGKTAVMIDIAGCVATGTWWHGAEVHQGPVLYVIAEGAAGIPHRWEAWKRRNGLPGDHQDLVWLPAKVNLRSALWATAIADVAADIKPALVVLDTLSRTFGNGNENASEDMGAYVSGIDLIREATSAAVVPVHHTGKDQAAGARGHSVLLGALDVELVVRNGGDGIITFESTKQKDRAIGAPKRFTLEQHGESIAVAPYNGHNAGDALTKKAATVLAALERIATPEGVTMTAWRETAESDSVSRSTFYEARKLLLERGLVRNLGKSERGPFAPAQDGDDA
jgi:RecA-family ATPase